MPPRTSSHACTSVRSRKSSGKVTDSDSVQVTLPTSPAVVSVPPTPRTRKTPANSPAVQMRAPPPTPVVSRRLSFGTIEDVVVDASQSSSPRKLSARASKVASAVTEKEEVVSVTPDSPPPKHVEPKGHKVQAKGRSGAKAQSGGMEPPLTGKLQPSTPRPRSGNPPPIFAHNLGSSTDIFGSPVDNSTGGIDNSMDINSASGSAKANQTELLDGIVFAGIHPLLSNIVTYLRSSSIASRLQYSELLPKYTARDEHEGDVPKFLNVMGRMKNEYAMPIIVDCLCFHGYGMYVNPLTADPAHFRVVNKKIMFKPSMKRLLYPIFVMPVVVQLCDLLTPTCTSEQFQEERLRLTRWIFDEVSALFATFIRSILNQNIVYAYMTESTLQFTSRPAKVEASVPSTPQKSAQHSFAFGRLAPRAGNKAGQSAAKAALQFTHLRHPHSLGAEDTIPIYNGRLGHSDFRAEDQQWETIANMPRLGVPTPPLGQQPDYSQAVEIPPFEPTQFCVALVAFTMGTFMPMDNPAAPHVSFNLQFAILLESWVSKLKPHAVTEQRINTLRIAAASQANALANAAATTQPPN
ncbi:hypothetical protein BDN71DRAFT_1456913 [Pleurotus eryngii]|uniref:Uncharacterized protein n=1 Tax=Pleurotus eryngii TaxID=5323 RepID=A0A9P5ZK12_PLEER|nr:hypothetical protein BDN71DRAFT_1456913 [Pleurotus eryngii]